MRYLALFLIMFSLISCRKHSQEVSIPAHKITMGVMKFDVPIDWSIQIDKEDQIAYADMERSAMAFIGRDKCESGYNSCMILALRAIAEAGFQHDSAEDVMINNHKFFLLTSHYDKLKVWSWLSLIDNQVFTVTCGGLVKDPYIEKDCFDIGASIKVQ